MSGSLPALVLPVIKNRGMTSFDVVRQLKRKRPRAWKKIGHFGTLDPFAQGLLLVGVNGSLRANQYVHDFSPKVYIGVGKLGEKTDTGDDTGEVIETDSLKEYNFNAVQETLDTFIGEYWQQPPYYSATKHEGKPLYEWAREGTFIEKPQVKREIYSLKLLEISKEEIKFEVSVSSGTYIRKLVEDIAFKLDTIAHLNFLERTSIGKISLNEALDEDIWMNCEPGESIWLENALPIDKLVNLDSVHLPNASTYINGIPLREGQYELRVESASVTQELVWVYDKQESLIGMGKLTDKLGIKSIFNLPTN